jgi:hypothetical protein
MDCPKLDAVAHAQAVHMCLNTGFRRSWRLSRGLRTARALPNTAKAVWHCCKPGNLKFNAHPRARPMQVSGHHKAAVLGGGAHMGWRVHGQLCRGAWGWWEGNYPNNQPYEFSYGGWPVTAVAAERRAGRRGARARGLCVPGAGSGGAARISRRLYARAAVGVWAVARGRGARAREVQLRARWVRAWRFVLHLIAAPRDRQP